MAHRVGTLLWLIMEKLWCGSFGLCDSSVGRFNGLLELLSDPFDSHGGSLGRCNGSVGCLNIAIAHVGDMEAL